MGFDTRALAVKPVLTVSPTQLNRFLCRLAWIWAKKYGVPKQKTMDLALGLGIHEALRAYYGEERDPVRVFSAWASVELSRIEHTGFTDDVQTAKEAKDMGVFMLKNYMAEYKGDRFKTIAVEKAITLNIPHPETGEPTEYAITVKLDALINKGGKLYVMEHKTFSTFSPEYLQRDMQMTALHWSAGQQWDDVWGVIYNGLRKLAPGKKKSSRTAKPFERHVLCRNEHQIKLFLDTSYYICCEMMSPTLRIYPNPGAFICRSCAFKKPCTEYMRGGSYEAMLKNLYTKPDKEVDYG